ncbi:Pentatricopeptide repeat [Dillenia turbinata]|uniref:Pentatricopeptide repeat n=1 Tax=Dillenia turbinata TaxID=194707 RepID=A0AAN8VR17_9MAGN
MKPRRLLTTCPLPIEPLESSLEPINNDLKNLRLSLMERLIARNFIPSAQKMLQRIICQTSSALEAVSVIEFASVGGMEIDLCSYAVLLSKLVRFGEPLLAEAFYFQDIVRRGIEPNHSVLSSLVICFCKLDKLDEARIHFDRIFELNSLPCKEACHLLIHTLCVQGRALEGFDCLIRVNDAGMEVGFGCFSKLIDGLSFGGNLDEALQMFDIMSKKNGYLPCPRLYKSLFYGLCKRGRLLEAQLLCGDMELDGLFVDKTMFTALINGYCKDKKMKMAMQVFLRMLKIGCEPDGYTYNTLIHGFVKLGLADKSRIIWNQMAMRGLQPDLVSNHIMINKHCEEGKVERALAHFKELHRRNVVLPVHFYTVLISALYKENRLSEVDQLCEQMVKSGVVPDNVLLQTLIPMYPKGDELRLTFVILQAVAKNGCHIDPSLLSVASSGDIKLEIRLLLQEIMKRNLNLGYKGFEILITGLCAGGNPDDALLCMDEIMSLGCTPSTSSYNSLIKCLFEVGLSEDVESVLDIMQVQGVVPNLGTYLIMVHGYCNIGDFVSAYAALDHMVEAGIRPSVAIYNTIVTCLCREKRISEAEDIFKRMLKSGVDPDEVMYLTMINGYSKNGKALRACQLFEKMVECGIQPSYRAYTALINGLVKKNRLTEGYHYLQQMLNNGFMPNGVFCTALMNQALRKGALEFGLRLFDLMERTHMERDLITYIALGSGVCRNITNIRKRGLTRWVEIRGDKLLRLIHQKIQMPMMTNLRLSCKSPELLICFVLKLMHVIKESPYMPNLYLCNCLISGFFQADRILDAYDIFEMMQIQGVRPNQVTFTILMDGNIKSGNIDLAVGFFNKMNADGCAIDGVAYNTLLDGLCQARRPLDALTLAQSMHKRGLIPNWSSYRKLLHCLCTCNYSSDLAVIVLKEMFCYGYYPSWHNYVHLLCALSEESKLSEAEMRLQKVSFLACLRKLCLVAADEIIFYLKIMEALLLVIAGEVASPSHHDCVFIIKQALAIAAFLSQSKKANVKQERHVISEPDVNLDEKAGAGQAGIEKVRWKMIVTTLNT